MRIVNFALYQLIYQYGLLVWGGLNISVLKKLQSNQNNIVSIYLNISTLEESTNTNYKDLSVLPIKFLYKRIIIMFTFTHFIKGNKRNSFFNKRERLVYNIPVKYTNKSFGY
jgi:hypothetical protein